MDDTKRKILEGAGVGKKILESFEKSDPLLDTEKLERMKNELAIISNHVETLKKILANAKEITELLEKNPDIEFSYTVLFMDKTVLAKIIAGKMTEKVLPEITKLVALKIAERFRLEKQIKELESGAE